MSVIANVLGGAFGAEEVNQDWHAWMVKELSYTISLQKKDGMLGLAYRVVDDKEGLTITGVVRGSAVQDWNDVCDDDQTVCVGDQVRSVNGETDTRAMVQVLQVAPVVNIGLMKMGPRWHMSGVTAECMEKIKVAVDRGMTMVVAREDGAVRDGHDDQQELTKFQSALVFGTSLMPNLLLLAVLSDMGYGIQFYSMLAPSRVDLMGRGMVCCSLLYAVSLHVVDWSRWTAPWQKRTALAVCCYGCLLGGLLMARNYPELPLVVVLLHIPVLLGVLRATALKSVHRPSFYGGVAKCLAAISAVVLALWLAWMNVPAWDGTHRWDARTKADLTARSQSVYREFPILVEGTSYPMVSEWYCALQTPEFLLDYELFEETGKLQPLMANCGWETPKDCKLSQASVSKVKQVCASVKTTWLLAWASPLICFGTNFLFSLFCAINAAWLRVADLEQLEKAMKNFLLALTMAAAGGWVSISVAGASTRLTGALLSFCAAGMLVLCAWVYLEIGSRAVAAAVKNSKMMRKLLGLATSDWARACFVVPVYLVAPMLLAVDCVKQRVRRLREPHTTQRALFTSGASMLFRALATWRWVSILTKTNMLAMVYWTLMSGAGKFAVVFLSWLNEKLSDDFSFVASLSVFFVVGFLMFMLPPVPGIPVYWCAGIIVVAQAKKAGVGFTLGTFVAVGLSVVLKCVAACGQYMIGYTLGWSVKVQQQVGVDRILVKAIEKILQERGLSLSKVAVLIGGPDWPTSVLCGILRISIPQMLIGTLPIVFLCAPSVLFGAFLVTPIEDGVEDVEGRAVWATLSNMMLGMSALSQLLAACMALYFMQDRVFSCAEELSEPRPEHAKIIALTESEAAYNACYDRVADWSRLSVGLKILLLASTTCMLMQGYLLTLFDSLCFRPFQVYNKISAPHDEEGLNGDVSTFILPGGRLAMLLFAVGCACHFSFVWATGLMARRALAEEQVAEVEAGPPEVTIQPQPELALPTLALAPRGLSPRKGRKAGAEPGFQPGED